MPAQVNFANDHAARRETTGTTPDGGNSNIGVDVRLRNEVSGYRHRRNDECNDTTNSSYSSSSSCSSESSGSATSGISCGIRIGRPTLASWASSMTSSLPDFHDVPPPMFAVLPSYRTVGTQTDNVDDVEDVNNGLMYENGDYFDEYENDLPQCLSDDVSDEIDDEDLTGMTSLNSSSRSENESIGCFSEDFVDCTTRCCSSCFESKSREQRDNDDLNDSQVTNLEITLRKSTVDEKIGLTLFYRTYFDDSTCAFVGEIDPAGLAGKDGRIQRGDQIIKVDGAELQSREQALQMFGTRRLGVTLSVIRRRQRSRCPASSPSHSNTAECQPQASVDDGFLDDLAFLDRHQPLPVPPRRLPHPSFYMLAKTLECIDEEDADDNEDANTDDTTDFSSSNRHEDSGVGRTDDSTRNEESSEQELPDIDGATSLGSVGGGSRSTRLCSDQYSGWQHRVDNEDRDVSVADEDEHHEVVYEGPSPIQCQQFYAMLKERCNAGLMRKVVTASSMAEGCENSADRDDRTLSNSAPPIPPRSSPQSYTATEKFPRRGFVTSAGVECYPVSVSCNSSAAATITVSRRPVPRMGTRIDTVAPGASGSPSRQFSTVQLPCSPEVNNQTLSLRLASTNDMAAIDASLQPSGRALWKASAAVADNTDSSPSSATTIVEKTRLPTRQVDIVSGWHNAAVDIDMVPAASLSGNDRAEAYRRCGADVMLTNRANLRHTIALQQTLFQQQMVDKGRGKLTQSSLMSCPPQSPSSSEKTDNSPSVLVSKPALSTSCGLGLLPPTSGQASRPTDLPLTKSTSQPQQRQNGTGNATNPASLNAGAVVGDTGVKMEWVVKRRSDGTRYVTRRPVKSTGSSGRRSTKPPSSGAVRDSRPRVRYREAAEQRWAAATNRREVACSTDDDDGSSAAVSELKAGRYWTREQRRQHVEQRKERQAVKQQKKAEAVAVAAAAASSILERTIPTVQTTLTALKSRSAVTPVYKIDTFATADEIVARGNRGASGRYLNDRDLGMYQSEHQPLLSVTTV